MKGEKVATDAQIKKRKSSHELHELTRIKKRDEEIIDEETKKITADYFVGSTFGLGSQIKKKNTNYTNYKR
jgi:hypothetical protein